MISTVKENLLNHVKKGDTLLLGISGGVDSIVLFHCLLSLQKELEFKIILTHLNHNLRGEESKKDKELVKTLAEKHNTPLFTKDIDLSKETTGLEEKGRTARYDFFQNTATAQSATFILTAHHANDSLETVLMNMTRGCALRGLRGIELKRNNIIRPLFNITKEQILAYAQKHNLIYREDSSNQDTKFFRNKIRHQVVPLLKEKNPHLEKTFLEQQSYFIETHNQKMETAKAWLTQFDQTFTTFPTKEFSLCTESLQKDIIEFLYVTHHNSSQNLSHSLIKEVITLIKNNKTNTQTHFGTSFLLKISYNNASINRDSKSIQRHSPKMLPLNSSTEFGSYLITTHTHSKIDTFKKNHLYCALNKEETLHIRTWDPGDRFHPLNLNGTKKLQDFFTDEKIPQQERHSIPIITTSNNKVVTVGPHRIDHAFRITPSTKKILEIKIEKKPH